MNFQFQTELARYPCVRHFYLALALAFVAALNTSPATGDTVDNFAQMHVGDAADADAQTAMLRKAFEFFQQQEFDECLSQLDLAHEYHPTLPPARVSLALFFMDVGQANQARQQLEISAVRHADSPITFDAFGPGIIPDEPTRFGLSGTFES